MSSPKNSEQEKKNGKTNKVHSSQDNQGNGAGCEEDNKTN